MDEVIICRSLTKRFGSLVAVDSLDLVVSRGDVFGFLGPNGAGKSTTLRMMVGLIRPSSGSISVFGRDAWRSHRSAMRRAGALIESPAFYRYLSGRDNLRVLANSGGSYSRAEINAALETVGLTGRAADKVKTYSQGMRQRLGIACAIVGNPELILLDEPTNGLDPQGMKEVRDLIVHLARERGITVFLSSHLLHEVEQTCTRIAVVNKGKVVASGDVSELLSGADTYLFRVEPMEAALGVVRSLAWASAETADEGALHVRLTGSDSAELNRVLVHSGVAVSEISPVRKTLEDLYLGIMHEDNA